jgi:hypothetical protein
MNKLFIILAIMTASSVALADPPPAGTTKPTVKVCICSGTGTAGGLICGPCHLPEQGKCSGDGPGCVPPPPPDCSGPAGYGDCAPEWNPLDWLRSLIFG